MTRRRPSPRPRPAQQPDRGWVPGRAGGPAAASADDVFATPVAPIRSRSVGRLVSRLVLVGGFAGAAWFLSSSVAHAATAPDDTPPKTAIVTLDSTLHPLTGAASQLVEGVFHPETTVVTPAADRPAATSGSRTSKGAVLSLLPSPPHSTGRPDNAGRPSTAGGSDATDRGDNAGRPGAVGQTVDRAVRLVAVPARSQAKPDGFWQAAPDAGPADVSGGSGLPGAPGQTGGAGLAGLVSGLGGVVGVPASSTGTEDTGSGTAAHGSTPALLAGFVRELPVPFGLAGAVSTVLDRVEPVLAPVASAVRPLLSGLTGRLGSVGQVVGQVLRPISDPVPRAHPGGWEPSGFARIMAPDRPAVTPTRFGGHTVAARPDRLGSSFAGGQAADQPEHSGVPSYPCSGGQGDPTTASGSHPSGGPCAAAALGAVPVVAIGRPPHPGDVEVRRLIVETPTFSPD